MGIQELAVVQEGKDVYGWQGIGHGIPCNDKPE
jgi:hypothetical protein